MNYSVEHGSFLDFSWQGNKSGQSQINDYSDKVTDIENLEMFVKKTLWKKFLLVALFLPPTHSIASVVNQYATSLINYSSQYSTSNWSASQVLGGSNTSSYGDIATSWAPGPRNGTYEYISVRFSTPVYANGTTIRETYGNGFVYKVDAIDVNGSLHTVWTGSDTSQPGSPANFRVTWTDTDYLVNGLKVYINTDHNLSAWEEIDSILLHGNTQPVASPSIPSAPIATLTDNTLTLTWSEPVDATYYKLSYRDGSGSWQISGSQYYNGSNSWTNVEPINQRSYRIMACASTCSDWSASSNAITVVPATPQATLEASTLTLSYTPVPQATFYNISYKDGAAGDWQTSSTRYYGSSQVWTNVEPINQRSYRIMACASTCSNWSEGSNAISVVPATPQATLDESTLTLSYTPVPQATFYSISYKDGAAGDWQTSSTRYYGSSQVWTLSSSTVLVDRFYRIQGCYNNCSAWSAASGAVNYPTAPETPPIQWDSSSVVVGQGFLLQNADASIVECHSASNSAIKVMVEAGVSIAYTVSETPISDWQCFDAQSILLQEFEASLIITKLAAPVNLQIIE
jgi:hypothetical protein